MTEEEELELLELEALAAAGLEAEQEEEPESDISKTESALRGVRQGATLGFADELQGAIGAGLDWMTGLGDEQAAMLGQEPAGFTENYRGLRNATRAEEKAARDANPMSYMGGEMAGSLLIPGGSGAGAVSTVAGAGRALGRAAAEGAAYGLGASEGESLGEMAADAGMGGVMSAGTSGLLQAVGRAGKAIASPFGGSGKLVNPLTGQRKPITLTDSTPGALMRTVGAAPGARGKFAAQEAPFVEEAVAGVAKAKDRVNRIKRTAEDIGDQLKGQTSRVKQAGEAAKQEALETADRLAKSTARQFNNRAVNAATPDGVSLPRTGNLADDAEAIANWWTKEGFQEVKGQNLPWNKNFKETKLFRNISERIKEDPDLRLALEDTLPKIQAMNTKFLDPTTEMAAKSSGEAFDAIRRVGQGRLEGPVDETIKDVLSQEFLSGEAIMAMRNVFATGANGGSKNRGPLRQIANEFDDIIRKELDDIDPSGALTQRFDQNIERYTTALTLQDVARKTPVLKRNSFTPEEWLASAKKYSGKGMSTKRAPLRNAAVKTGQQIDETLTTAKKQGLEMAREAQKKASDITDQVRKTKRTLQREAEESTRTGELAKAVEKARVLKNRAMPENTSILRDVLSAEYLGGLTPMPSGNRTARAAQGYGVGKLLAADATQDILGGQTGLQRGMRKLGYNEKAQIMANLIRSGLSREAAMATVKEMER